MDGGFFVPFNFGMKSKPLFAIFPIGLLGSLASSPASVSVRGSLGSLGSSPDRGCDCVSQSGRDGGIANREFQTNPDFFHDFLFIYQFCHNGLDSDRFCAPEIICDL